MSFAAYIISYRAPDNDQLRAARSEITKKQLKWWLEKTTIQINVIAMNYNTEDYLEDYPKDRIKYHDFGPMKTGPARTEAIKLFYESDNDFAIMLDDDSILYDKPQHNLGPLLFEEMDAQLDKYKDVDVFFPINPQVSGFTPIYNKDPKKYADNHVFRRNLSLKGSLFVVRNFRKYNKTVIWPDLNFTWQDDHKFAMDCAVAGHSVSICYNIVLNEMSGKASNFAANPKDRLAPMLEANTRICNEFEHLGLKMKDGSHNMDKKEFIRNVWGDKPVEVVVPRANSTFSNLFEF